jgi:colanic acid/amylovoran biosynthesis glycosyltransferase
MRGNMPSSRSGAHSRLAYLVSKFPTVTETFILRELIEVERRGICPALYTIRRENPEVIHEDAIPWMQDLRTAKYSSPRTWMINARTFLKNPILYIGLILMTVRELWGCWHLFVRDLFVFPKAVAFARMMQDEGITHIHAHWATHTTYMAYIIYRLTGITYSFTAHAHDIYIRKAMLPRKVYNARFVAAISKFNVEELVHDCGEQVRDKIHVVRCGVSPEAFKPRAVTAKDPTAPFTILTVGSLRDYKGHPYAIQACKLLKERIKNFQWLVVGNGPDRDALTQMIKDNGVEDVFQLLGSRKETEVQKLMQAADVYVMASIMLADRRMEGIPVALMEALAVEVPTVATKISGIPELVIDNITGRLVAERDPQALADAIFDLYQHREKGRELGKMGREHVMQEFTVGENAGRLVKLFNEVLAA